MKRAVNEAEAESGEERQSAEKHSGGKQLCNDCERGGLNFMLSA